MGVEDDAWKQGMKEMLETRIGHLVLFATSMEALMALLAMTQMVVDQTGRLIDHDPEMAPELGAAVEHLTEVVDAFKRGHTFASARLSAQMDAE